STSSWVTLLRDRGYLTRKHKNDLTAKPWSKLSGQEGPSSESSIALICGAKKTRSLDLTTNLHETLERGSIDSLTPISSQLETTTFLAAVYRYFKDLLLLTKQ
ncbi:MAG: hypothetical protein ACXAB5_08385, partial [Candidatus Thorarchaeota archaeon]